MTTPSPVPDLVALKNEAATKRAALKSDPDVIARQAEANAKLKEYNELDSAYKKLPEGSPERDAAAETKNAAFNTWLESNKGPRADQAAQRALQAQELTYDKQLKNQEPTPTSPSPPASDTVEKTEKAAVAAGAEAAAGTNLSPGSPTGTASTADAPIIQTPVTQTNIDNTTNTTVPDESDPNQELVKRQTPPIAYVPSNIIQDEGDPNERLDQVISDITAKAQADNAAAGSIDFGADPAVDKIYADAAAAGEQKDNAAAGSIDFGADPAVDKIYADAAAAEEQNIDVKKRNDTVVSAAEEPGAYDAADRLQTKINDGVPDKSFAQSVQDVEDAYPRATGNDLNGVSFPNDGAPPPAQSPGVALASGAKDWRFRIQLAPSANYFYKGGDAGILAPLAATNGVIFPYTPQISLSYAASYTAQDLVHTNYKMHTYKNSSVESMTIAGDFTAQDTQEANYLLAVIHFFKSVTKMFYGQDQNPQRGIPPPLCYLTGFGQYQFDMHPVVITNFTYAFPVDVDYVNAYPTNNTTTNGGQNNQQDEKKGASTPNSANDLKSQSRLRVGGRNGTGGLAPGGLPPPPVFSNNTNINQITRVPSKITIQLTCQPIVTRNAISNKFSLAAYSTGKLLQGSVNPGTGGGIW